MRPYGIVMEPKQKSALDILASRPIVRILRYLVKNPGTHTGREIASAAHVTQARAVEALATLTRLGVVRRRKAGRAYLHLLNEANYLTSDILVPAFRQEADWMKRLGEEVLESVAGVAESIVLYGSWARGEATEHSDIDVLIVARDRHSAEAVQPLDDTRSRLTERFGRPVSFLVVPRGEFRRRLRRGDRLVKDIVRHGRVLAGRSLAELTSRE